VKSFARREPDRVRAVLGLVPFHDPARHARRDLGDVFTTAGNVSNDAVLTIGA
jgi:hypothetical protein